MYDLTLINQSGVYYIDSREVAEIIGKRHDHLLRDIGGYLKILRNSNAPNFGGIEFFVESSYIDSRGREKPCYLLTKAGCEICANKLTGEKGVLFTAAYVSKFNEMEAAERKAQVSNSEAQKSMPAPRLGEYNACVRIIIRAMRDMGAEPEKIIEFLKSIYEPLGIAVMTDYNSSSSEIDYNTALAQMYTAKQVADLLGIYSLNGNLHYQAVACLLNEILFIGDEHKRVVPINYGDRIVISIQYDQTALNMANDWICENGFPDEIYGFDRTYHVVYEL